MIGTGCRIGEAIGLQWGDISLDFKKVFIRRQLVDGIIKKPKCDSYREFILPSSLILLFKSLQRGKSNDFIFLINGHTIDRRSFLKRVWKPLLLSLGIEYRKPSSLRHNFCSWMLNNGSSVIETSKITGHDPKVLLDSYASMINELNSVPDLFDYGNP